MRDVHPLFYDNQSECSDALGKGVFFAASSWKTTDAY
jgi:hypothetical protein